MTQTSSPSFVRSWAALAALAAAVGCFAAPAVAADFFIVLPVKKKAAVEFPDIRVSLGAAALPNGFAGNPYTGFDFSPYLAVTGDADYAGSGVTWRASGGDLPPGLSLNLEGVLIGTPSATGTWNFTLGATYKEKTGSQSFNLTIYQSLITIVTATYGNNVGQPIGNLTFRLKGVCDTKRSCTFNPYQLWGSDPGVGYNKILSVNYLCGDMPRSLTTTIGTVGRNIVLDCG